MDALTHAIEGYTGPEWSPHGEAFSLQALRLMRDNLRARRRGHLERGRSRQHAGRRRRWRSCPAPAAPRPSAPCTRCRIRPGRSTASRTASANAINLPHVIRFNAAGGTEIADRYRDVAELLGAEAGGSDADVGDCAGELGHGA